MSKGSPIVQTRIPPRLLQEIDEAIARRNDNTNDELWTRSAFIIRACREKLDKMERSRGKVKKGRVDAGMAALAGCSAPAAPTSSAPLGVSYTTANDRNDTLNPMPDGSTSSHDIAMEASSQELPQVAG